MHVTLIGDKKDIYINPVNCNAFVDYTKSVNYDAVNLDGVNNLAVVRRDNQMKIIQAGGYTPDSGLFVDLY